MTIIKPSTLISVVAVVVTLFAVRSCVDNKKIADEAYGAVATSNRVIEFTRNQLGETIVTIESIVVENERLLLENNRLADVAKDAKGKVLGGTVITQTVEVEKEVPVVKYMPGDTIFIPGETPKVVTDSNGVQVGYFSDDFLTFHATIGSDTMSFEIKNMVIETAIVSTRKNRLFKPDQYRQRVKTYNPYVTNMAVQDFTLKTKRDWITLVAGGSVFYDTTSNKFRFAPTLTVGYPIISF